MNPTAELADRKAASASSKNQAKVKINWLRIAIHIIGIFPLAQLAYDYLTGHLTPNPIQFIEQTLGLDALYLLMVTLAVTPVITLTGWWKLARHRRALGLYAFFYFSLHFLTFAILDYGLDWGEIFRLAIDKPFIVMGVLSGLILLALAVTAFKYWMKRLGRSWKTLHRTIYLASILAILHYAMSLKGSLFALSGDIFRPLLMGILAGFLLILRIPIVRRWVVNRRFRMNREA
jgi:methionine sulfoxide reductase heme-binding subunit